MKNFFNKRADRFQDDDDVSPIIDHDVLDTNDHDVPEMNNDNDGLEIMV